jgi:hypothetical protein
MSWNVLLLVIGVILVGLALSMFIWQIADSIWHMPTKEECVSLCHTLANASFDGYTQVTGCRCLEHKCAESRNTTYCVYDGKANELWISRDGNL